MRGRSSARCLLLLISFSANNCRRNRHGPTDLLAACLISLPSLFSTHLAPAVLRACLREYLFSEALVGLGAATTVAVSVCITGEAALIRDPDPKNSGVLRRSPGAVLCRVAPSFLRFGSFELPARRGEVAVVRALADYCLRHLRPYLLSVDDDLTTSGHNLAESVLHHSSVGYSAGSATGSDHEKHASGKGCAGGSNESQCEYLELLITFVKVNLIKNCSLHPMLWCSASHARLMESGMPITSLVTRRQQGWWPSGRHSDFATGSSTPTTSPCSV